MADIRSDIIINVDTSIGIAEIKNLQRQISELNAQLLKSGAAQAKAAQNIQRNLINNINATGKFAANVRTISSTAESFTTALERNKLSMGQYFKYAGGASQTFGRVFTKEFNTIQKVAESRVKTLQTQYIKLGRDANGSLKAISVRPLALDMENLATKTAIAAQKQQLLNQLLKQGSTNLLNFGKNTQWAGRQLMVGFSIPLAYLGSIAAKTFMEMEEQSIRFKRVYGDSFTANSETDKMIDQIRSLGAEFTKYGVEAKETMKMAADAAAMGKTGQDLLAQVNQASRLAVLGGVDQSQALETTISLTNAFGLAADQLSSKIEFLNAVENQTVTSIEDLTIAIPKAGPVVKQLGGDVEDLAFFLTAMKEGGINASEGANALKSGLASLINPTSKASDFLKSFGVNVNQLVDSNKGDVKGLVIDFAQALDTLDPLNRARAIEQMFGKFQFARLSTLFQNVITEGTQADRVLKLAGSSTTELAVLAERELKRVEASPMFKFKKAVEDLKVSLIPLGEAFLKAITPVIEFAKGLLERFNAMGDGVKNFIVIATAVLAGLGPVVLMTFGLIANGAANIIKLFANMSKMFSGAGSASGNLATQTEYMTQQQLEAAAVAASLDQSHSKLIQTFGVEVTAVNNLATAYAKAVVAQSRLLAVPLRGVAKTGGGKVSPKKYASGIVSVPGPKGAGDIVPAMLSPGEAVIPAKQSAKYSGLIQGMVNDTIPGYKFGRFGAAASRMAKNVKVSKRSGPKEWNSLVPEGKDWSVGEGLIRTLTKRRGSYGPTATEYENKLRDKFMKAPNKKVAVRMFSDDLVGALSRGETRYKNIFERGGKSRGGLDTNDMNAQRAKVENSIFGFDSKTDPSKRPAYGYLFNKELGLNSNSKSMLNRLTGKNDPNDKIDMARSNVANSSRLMNENTYRYGDVAMVLKNKSLRGRTTITQGDSLNGSLGNYATPAKLGSRNRKELEAAKPSSYKRDFFEAQILGGFSFKDIKKIVATEPQTIMKLQASLQQAGIRGIKVGMPKMTMMQKLKKLVYGKKTTLQRMPRMQSEGPFAGTYRNDPMSIGNRKFYKDGVAKVPSQSATDAAARKAERSLFQMSHLQNDLNLKDPKVLAQIYKAYPEMAKIPQDVMGRMKFTGSLTADLVTSLNQGLIKGLPLDDFISKWNSSTGKLDGTALAASGKRSLSIEDAQGVRKIEDAILKEVIRESKSLGIKVDDSLLSRVTGKVLSQRSKLSGIDGQLANSLISRSKVLGDYRAKFTSQDYRELIDSGKAYVDGTQVREKQSGVVIGRERINKRSGAVTYKQVTKSFAGQGGYTSNKFMGRLVNSAVNKINEKSTPKPIKKPKISQDKNPKPKARTQANNINLSDILGNSASGVAPSMSRSKSASLGRLFGRKYATGVVSVPGPKGAGDVVPAMLSPGEAVIPTAMAKKYAPIINSMISDSVPGYQRGKKSGFNFSSPPAMPQQSAEISIPPEAAKVMGESTGKAIGKSKGFLRGISTNIGNAVSDRAKIAVSKAIGHSGGFSPLSGGRVLDNDSKKIYNSEAELQQAYQNKNSGKKHLQAAQSDLQESRARTSGNISKSGNNYYKVDEFGKKVRVGNEFGAAELSKQEALANQKQKKAPIKQRMGRAAGGIGMVASTVGMGMMMSSDPGMQQAGGTVMAGGMLASFLPMLMNPVGAIVAGLVVTAGTIFLINKTLADATKAGQATARALTMTSDKLEAMAEITGSATATQISGKDRQTQLTGESSKKRVFGQEYLNSEAGMVMLQDAAKMSESGMSNQQVASNFAEQLNYAILQGAVTQEQAASIAFGLGEKLQDYSISSNIIGNITALYGRNGENLLTDPLLITAKIQEAQTSQQTAAFDNSIATQDKNRAASDGAIGNSIGGGVMIAGGIAAGLIAASAATAVTGILAPLSALLLVAGAVTLGATAIAEGVADTADNNEARGVAVQLGAEQLAQNQGLLDSLDRQYTSQLADLELKKSSAKTDKEKLAVEDEINKKIIERDKALISQKNSNAAVFAELMSQASSMGNSFTGAVNLSIDEKYKEATGGVKAAVELAKKDLESIPTMSDGKFSNFKATLQLGLASGEFDPVTVSNLINANKDGNGVIETKFNALVTTQGTADANQIMQLLGKAGVAPKNYSVILDLMNKDPKLFKENTEALAQIANMPQEYGISISLDNNGDQKIEDVSKFLKETSDLPDQVTKTVLTKYMADHPGMSAEAKAILQDQLLNWDVLSGGDNKVSYQVMVDYVIGKADPADIMAAYLVKNPQLANMPADMLNKYYTSKAGADFFAETTNPNGNGNVNQNTGNNNTTVAKQKSPYEDMLKDLKVLRDYTIDVTGGIKELKRVLNGKRENMTILKGDESKLLESGMSGSTANYFANLDEKTQKLFFKIGKSGKVILTEAGRLMKQAFDEKAIGNAYVGIQATISGIKKQNIATATLVGLGLDYASAVELAGDADLSAAIASSKNKEELKVIVALKKQELELSKKSLAIANMRLAIEQNNKNVINQAALNSFNSEQQSAILSSSELMAALEAGQQNSENFRGLLSQQLAIAVRDDIKSASEAVQSAINDFVARDKAKAFASKTFKNSGVEQIILNDAQLVELISKAQKAGTVLGMEFYNRLNQLLSDEQALQQVFDNGMSAAMDAFSIQEQTVDIKFNVDTAYLTDIESGIIPIAERQIATIQYQMDDYEAGIEQISNQEEIINKKYDERSKALDRVLQVTEKLNQENQAQLDIAGALSRGDIGAAAQAVQAYRSQQAQARVQTERSNLENAKEKELGQLVSSNGLTREQLTEKIKNLKKEIFNIEEQTLEPAQRALDLAENQRDIDISNVSVLGRTRLEWDQIQNNVDLARINNEGFKNSLLSALGVVERIKAEYEAIGKISISLPASPTAGMPASVTAPAGTPAVTAPPAVPVITLNPKQDQIDELNRRITTTRWRVKNEAIDAAKKKAYIELNEKRINEVIRLNGTPDRTGMTAPGTTLKIVDLAPGFASGGVVPKYLRMGGMLPYKSEGGSIFKPLGTDTIPAMLSPGEFVVRKYAVDKFGVDNLKAINSGKSVGSSMYNYDVSIHVKSDANADQIAKAVISQIKQVDSQRIRGNRF